MTLIFRNLEKRWRDEHPLNIAAAIATSSNFSHVEIALGDEAGANNEMCNVVRIFNDSVGVEVCERTGRSPNFQYLQLGCSKRAEIGMLQFALQQKGKPFSMTAMVRSIVYPRVSTYQNYFCAELVAAILKQGGLLSKDCNPGAATPKSLYDLYSKHAAATGNPFTMRNLNRRQQMLEEGIGFSTSDGGEAPTSVRMGVMAGLAGFMRFGRRRRLSDAAPKTESTTSKAASSTSQFVQPFTSVQSFKALTIGHPKAPRAQSVSGGAGRTLAFQIPPPVGANLSGVQRTSSVAERGIRAAARDAQLRQALTRAMGRYPVMTLGGPPRGSPYNV